MRRSTALLTAIAAVTATLATLPSAQGAASGWTTPTTLSTAGVNATSPDVAVDGHGVVHAVWIETAANGHGVVEYARRPSGAGWTDPMPLSTDALDAFEPSIATNFAGYLVVAWSSASASEVVPAVIRRRSPGGTWTPRVTVSAPDDNTGLVRATLNNDGDLAVSWENLDPVTKKREAVVRVRLSGKAWSSAHELGAHTVNQLDPQVVIDGNGNVTAAWTSLIGPPRSETTQVWVASKPAGRTWRGATKVSGTSVDDGNPSLALRGGTTPWLAWQHDANGIVGIWLRHRTAAGWSPAIRVSSAGEHSFTPTLDANARGHLLVAWTNLSPKLQSRQLTPAGHWKPVAVATNPGGALVSSPQLQIAGDGTAYVVWLSGGGRATVAHYAPRANAWGGLTAVPGSGTVSAPDLAVNPAARAALIWRRVVDPARIRAMLHG
jgi:hypothetical protein